eukprot:GHVP01020961.1.p1 GENE.GHVP01020961.1~~GHVP01020961.1.p1  ORF type:complete len:376 (+),score=68.23 GHVP01020961.1:682-1809(+)
MNTTTGKEFECNFSRKRRLSVSSSRVSIGTSEIAAKQKSRNEIILVVSKSECFWKRILRNEICIEVSKVENNQTQKSRNEICVGVSKAENTQTQKSRNEICIEVSKTENPQKQKSRNEICIEVSKTMSNNKPVSRSRICIEISKIESIGKSKPRNKICMEVSKEEGSHKPISRNKICIGVCQDKISQVANTSPSKSLIKNLKKLGLRPLCWVWHRSSFFKCTLLSMKGGDSNLRETSEILCEAKIGSEIKVAPLQDFQPSRKFLGLLGKLADIPFVIGEVVEVIKNSSDERKLLVIGDTTADEVIGNDSEGKRFSIKFSSEWGGRILDTLPVRCCICTPGGKWMFISPQKTTSHLKWPPVSLINGIEYEKQLQNK